MSRTYKDKPFKVLYPDGYYEHEDKPKKLKTKDTEGHWMSTPSWWTHLFMTKPQRRQGRLWEAEMKKTQDADQIEEADAPGVSHKPHRYYW